MRLFFVAVFIIISFIPNITQAQAISDSITKDSCDCNSSTYERPYSLTANCYAPSDMLNNTALFMGGAVGVVGVLYLMPESVTSWNKKSFNFENVFGKWKNNVTSGPKLDRDGWMMNYIAHPYFGAVYYTSARSLGYSAANSFLYSAAMSTFIWEYGFEAFAEVPSAQDLVITPVVGAIVGELFYIAKRNIIQNDYNVLNSKLLGHFIVFLIDPINEVNNLIFDRKSY